MGATKVTAPMPGTVVSIKVNVGDTVKADTLVAVLEAMKMENEIFAGADGVVASINANAGDSVNTGDVLVSLN
jgi:biotin carboxyl carrier protein